MIYMILYEEECKGLVAVRRYLPRGPRRCARGLITSHVAELKETPPKYPPQAL